MSLLQPTTVRWGKSAVYTCTIGHRNYQENVGFPILLSLEKKSTALTLIEYFDRHQRNIWLFTQHRTNFKYSIDVVRVACIITIQFNCLHNLQYIYLYSINLF